MPIDLKELARYGAKARLTELQHELEAIYRAFPDLGSANRSAGRRTTAGPSVAVSPSKGTTRKRQRMSAAQRKAVSVRMRKYWAARRKEQQ